MWFVSGGRHARVVEELASERTHAAEQITTLRTQMAFLVAQINQLSKERVIYLRHITHLDLPIPELAVAAPTPPMSPSDMLAAIGSDLFNDMGDTEAQRQGITRNVDGRVVYAGAESAHG